MMIKLVVTDMDGTLLSQKCGISPRNLKAIHMLQSQNIEFAIASGRDYDGVFSIVHQYGIECDAILGNGAQYVDQDGHVLMSSYMNKDILKDVVHVFEEAHLPYMIFTTKGFYTGCQPHFVKDSFIERAQCRFGSTLEDYQQGGPFYHSPCNHLIYIDDFDQFLTRNLQIIKVESFSLNALDMIPVKEKLKDIPTISYLSSFDDNIEVTNQTAQKGYILEKVIQQKNYSKEEVVVLGDGMNDYSLFECFPYSFAPQNAEPIIQKMAYRIVDDCENDGFAEAIDIVLKDLGH